MAKRLLVLLLIFSVSVFVFIAGKHHHRDGKIHPECQICLMQANFNSESAVSLTFDLPEKVVFFEFNFHSVFKDIVFYSDISNKSPPSLH